VSPEVHSHFSQDSTPEDNQEKKNDRQKYKNGVHLSGFLSSDANYVPQYQSFTTIGSSQHEAHISPRTPPHKYEIPLLLIVKNKTITIFDR
jgi:hypothetical protein